MTDFSDEQGLIQFARESIVVAEQYAESRKAFAGAQIKLNAMVGQEFNKPESQLKSSMALEKCYVALANIYPEAKIAYENYITEEQNYKGLEAVLNARSGYVTLHQSLIKNARNSA